MLSAFVKHPLPPGWGGPLIGVKPLRKHGSDVSIVVNTFALSGLTKNMDRDAYASPVGYESDQNHMDHHQIDPRVPTINF